MHCVAIQRLTLMQNCIVGQMRDDASVVVIGQGVMQSRRVLCKRCHDASSACVARLHSRNEMTASLEL